MNQKSSTLDYFIKLSLTFVGGVVFVFIMVPWTWNIIHREETLAKSIPYIKSFNIQYGDPVLGDLKYDMYRYTLTFSNNKKWGGQIFKRKAGEWKAAKSTFNQVLKIDTAGLEQKLPLTLNKAYFKQLSDEGILFIDNKDGNWKLLKIGNKYLVGSELNPFEILLLYILLLFFFLAGSLFVIAPFYLLITDTKGLKDFNKLTYQPSKWDGLMYVLRGFKHEEKEKNEGESFKKGNQN